MLMQGVALPIGVLNSNGWGIPDDENIINSAINSLISSKVRICQDSNESEHHCDFSNDDTSNIGNVVDAWRNDDNIEVKLDITNENAISKFKSNEWGKSWSVYGYGDLDDTGFIKNNYENRSITFVNNPAFKDTVGKIVAASTEKNKLHSNIELSASVFESDFGGKDMPEEVTEEVDETSETNETITKLEKLVEDEKLRNSELDKQLQEFIKKETESEPIIKPEENGNIPESTVNDMIELAINKERENIKKENAIENYKNFCSDIKLDIKPEDLERFNDDRFMADDINREINSIKNVYLKVNKTPIGVTGEPSYTGNPKKENEKNPEDYQGDVPGWTVGTPDMWDK